MTYHEREQYIYDQLTKNIDESGLYFSLRKNGSVNARRDIFIGTEKSGYFNFSMWNIPIWFAGSSGNFIDFILYEKNDDSWSFKFRCAIPRKVRGGQNRLSLSFLSLLTERTSDNFKSYTVRKSDEQNRLMFLDIDHDKSYTSFDNLYEDLKNFINEVVPYIDSLIDLSIANNPSWEAGRFNRKDWDKFNESYQRRLERYPLEVTEKEEVEIQNDAIEMINPIKPEYPNNQILYGPPGTGKTYRSIEFALNILGIETKGLSREDIVKSYEDNRKEGKIAFTTFHQSMSYEDFIEGIKPSLDDVENEISYEIKDGILKHMSKLAIQEYVKWSDSASMTFEDRYDKLLELINSSDTGYSLNSKTGSKLLLKEVTAKDNIKVSHDNGSRTYIVSKMRLEKVFHGIADTSDVTNINKAIRNIIGGSNATAYWAVNEFLNKMEGEKSAYEINPHLTDSQSESIIKNVDWTNAADLNVDRYVLIIDEINRGNVSAIFGELITLLEDDKRLDSTNKIVLKLPYSKIDFGLPSNLYIIGTMNTADRSVEALDTALRRRFSFEELLPEPKVISMQSDEQGVDDIDGINLVNVLETINKRIELILDKDHTIGHSYFLGINDQEGLKDTFKNKIIPLLQEYFYNDYYKLELVLGEGFVERRRVEAANKIFAGNRNNIDIDIPEFKYSLLPINKDFDVFAATSALLNLSEESSDEES